MEGVERFGVVAVNVHDIVSVPIFGLCFGQHCQSRLTIWPNGRRGVDEVGLVLECGEEQALAIVEVLRIKRPIRAYKSTPRGWVNL